MNDLLSGDGLSGDFLDDNAFAHQPLGRSISRDAPPLEASRPDLVFHCRTLNRRRNTGDSHEYAHI